MTTGPFPCSSATAFLGHDHTTQIQSITDESRSSIRRKNQGAAQTSNLSRQSSQTEDTQEDEVVDFVNPLSLIVRHTGPSSQSWIFGYSSHLLLNCFDDLI